MSTAIPQQDSREQEVKPPMNEPPQAPPGHESQMNIQPDYGEQTYKGSGKLEGRAALITGADSGIGRAVALALAREGADVLISYLNEDDDARETERVVTEAGRRAVLVPGDISHENHCQQLVTRAFQEFGKLDILVNNAAFQMTHQSIQELSSEEWDHTFRTNIYAMFYLCKAALPRMSAGGAIINTSSIEAFQPEPSLLAYAATKAAIYNFTKALAKEAAQQGVRVNAVAPGPIWTPLIPSTMPEHAVKNFGSQVPMKRAGQPAELATAYVMLADPLSSYTSGTTVAVTGGKPFI